MILPTVSESSSAGHSRIGAPASGQITVLALVKVAVKLRRGQLSGLWAKAEAFGVTASRERTADDRHEMLALVIPVAETSAVDADNAGTSDLEGRVTAQARSPRSPCATSRPGSAGSSAVSQCSRWTARGSAPSSSPSRSRTEPATPRGLRLSLDSPHPTRPSSVPTLTKVQGRHPAFAPERWYAGDSPVSCSHGTAGETTAFFG
jgi:hypothetical protein